MLMDVKRLRLKSKPITHTVSCPECNMKHFWSRREALAYDAGKSVQLICIKCLTRYYVAKSGKNLVITKEREA